MAEERIITKEDLEKSSTELFSLLNQKELGDANKQQINAIVENNPGLLDWKDFTARITLPDLMTEYKKGATPAGLVEKSHKSLETTHQVLNNLYQLKQEGYFPSVENPAGLAAGKAWQANGETLATQTIKNITFMDSLEKDARLSTEDRNLLQNHNHDEYRVFLRQLYSGENSYNCNPKHRNIKGQKVDDIMRHVQEDRKTLSVDSQPKTLTVEELKNRAYQGTLTVEQAEQLRKHDDDKKVADMKNIPGDKKKEKHESKDKFRDEDVVKYMYEEWFLAGMSYIFNKIEDLTINTINNACNACADRASAHRTAANDARDAKIKEATRKAGTFNHRVSESMDGLSAECNAKTASFKDIIKDLRTNLNNPSPEWKYYKPEDPFIQQLQGNPAMAEKFLDAVGPELENGVKMLETTGKLAMNIAAIEMTDNFMANDLTWRKDGKNNKEYLHDDEIQAQFINNSKQTQRKILEAVSVISEDTRLLAELQYSNLPPLKSGETRPTMQAFIQQQINKEVNGFIKDLADKSQNASKLQQKNIAKGRFDSLTGAMSVTRDSEISRDIKNIHKTIDKKIQNGAVYDNQVFKDEHSKERIQIKTSLYEEAAAENSPRSMQNTFAKMKELNAYNQQTFAAQRQNAAERKKQVEIFKSHLDRRNTFMPAVKKQIQRD